jgi:hypothetical protein
METVLIVLTVVFGLVFTVLAMMMVHEVSKRGVKINFPLLRIFILKYIHDYKEVTQKESGKTGPLFYPCIASINAALILAIVLLLF